jgi:tight adherence protein B
VTRAALLAALAAGCGVLALWDLIATAQASRLGELVERLAAPLRLARREGALPTPTERRRLGLVAAGTLAAAGWLLAGPAGGAALGLAGPWVLVAVVRARRRRYLAELERQAPLVARTLADALAGGHSIRGAVGESARGVTGAAGAELRRASAALELGEPTEAVLGRLRRRAVARPYDTMVAAMLLQRDAGGDLARLLRGLAATLEEASRLEGEARAATAQARFTGLLVAALPAGAAALVELASPGYVGRLLQAPLTAWLLGCALGFQALALLLVQRMSRVRA